MTTALKDWCGNETAIREGEVRKQTARVNRPVTAGLNLLHKWQQLLMLEGSVECTTTLQPSG